MPAAGPPVYQEPPPPPPPPPPPKPPPPNPLDPDAAGRDDSIPAEVMAKLSMDDAKATGANGWLPTNQGVDGCSPRAANARAHFWVRPNTMA